ncbi:6348_t:CDS:2, partial [Cetraspora pellucida]
MSEDIDNISAQEFVPWLREIAEIVEKLVIFYQNVEHNKRICGVLMVRIQAARASINSLEICACEFPESTDFFTPENYINLRNFKLFLKKIEEFIKKVQNIQNYQFFLDKNSIKNEFYDLIDKFDDYMKSLNFSMAINIKHPSKDIELIKKDIDDMKEYLKWIMESTNKEQIDKIEEIMESTNKEQIDKIEEITLSNSELLQKITVKIEDLIRNKNAYDNPKMQKLIRKEIIASASLNPDDFILDQEKPIRGRVRKYHYKRFGEFDVALKELEQKTKMSDRLVLQIGILKNINESRDIVQYIGLVTINSRQFLVTQWAENGTLREYYVKRNPDIKIRARLALEIARGLNYLEAYKIFHHDVRSENVLVDYFEHAKITKFEFSRSIGDAVSSTNLDVTMENVRYMAPEKINNSALRYNSKCEVFSFGMLLWELAEQKLPFSETGNTVLAISQLIVDNTMNLKFSSHDVPKKWKSLVSKATQYKAIDRPEMKEILRKIRFINESINTTTPDASDSHNDLQTLTFNEAIEQTNLKNGSKERAWKTIVKYSEKKDDFTAKFWKGYYLFYKLVKFPYSDDERIQLAAKAFKEAADGANHKEAQFMYASCIYKKIPSEAIKYFKMAAAQQHTISMHNLGLLYYNGKYIDVDKKEGEYWFKRAAD